MSAEKRLIQLMEIWEDAHATKIEYDERGEPCPGAERLIAHVLAELDKLMPSLSPSDHEDAEIYFGRKKWDPAELDRMAEELMRPELPSGLGAPLRICKA